MNIINDTRQNLTSTFKHYVCMRLQFRSSVLSDPKDHRCQDKRYQEYCPNKH